MGAKGAKGGGNKKLLLVKGPIFIYLSVILVEKGGQDGKESFNENATQALKVRPVSGCSDVNDWIGCDCFRGSPVCRKY